MEAIKKLKNFFGGENLTSVETEIIKMIGEIEEERRKFKPGSIMDKRIDEKISLLLDLADRLKLNIREE